MLKRLLEHEVCGIQKSGEIQEATVLALREVAKPIFTGCIPGPTARAVFDPAET